ncbi:MAG: DUF3788 domain-containing protein [Lachnospiraceae bacterium]
MIDLQDKNHCPTLNELGEYIRNPLFTKFCGAMKTEYNCTEKIEFSACSMEKGWNIKFRKAGKTLCTIYPRELYFTVMVVIGQKQKAAVDAILPDCTTKLQTIYKQTREGNGQKWLMIDLEDEDDLYYDLFRLIKIRKS